MNTALIDAATFRALQDAAGKDFVAELVGTFLEEAPGMLADLRDARDKADADRFRRAAHSLKSNCATFGANALAGKARELELNGIAAAEAGGLDALEAAYPPVVQALTELARG